MSNLPNRRWLERSARSTFAKAKDLGEGSDGKVELWKHRINRGMCIAVKSPTRPGCREQLINEVHILKQLSHDNIVRFLGCDEYWPYPIGPAIFLEYCELGDANSYFSKMTMAYGHTPEETMWKFFADISKALNYLHNELPLTKVHGDVKPENVLVARPVGSTLSNDPTPRLPTFKLADLARVVPYMPGASTEWQGTCEYAPLQKERKSGATPAADIWALAGSLQYMAFGQVPVLRWETFIKLHPAVPELKRKYPDMDFRKEISVVYRPLDVDLKDVAEKWDWTPGHTTHKYSHVLNKWYAMCFETDPEKRITSADLVKSLVPVAERQIELIAARERRKATSGAIKAFDRRQRLEVLERYPPRRKPALPPRLLPRNSARPAVAARPVLAAKPAPAGRVAALRDPPTPKLERGDYGLRPRVAREDRKRNSTQDSDKSAKLEALAQKYYRGMKPKAK